VPGRKAYPDLRLRRAERIVLRKRLQSPGRFSNIPTAMVVPQPHQD